MKALTLALGVSILVMGCNQSSTSTGSLLNPETKAAYEKNLAVFKTMINAYENEQIDEWGKFVADSARWNPAGYGALPSTKEQWAGALTAYVADWDSIKLMNANYLPGLDQNTKEFDGSVRVYGVWVGRHKSGLETSVSYYATADFNLDGKVVVYSEYFDVGGLLSALKPKE